MMQRRALSVWEGLNRALGTLADNTRRVFCDRDRVFSHGTLRRLAHAFDAFLGPFVHPPSDMDQDKPADPVFLGHTVYHCVTVAPLVGVAMGMSGEWLAFLSGEGFAKVGRGSPNAWQRQFGKAESLVERMEILLGLFAKALEEVGPGATAGLIRDRVGAQMAHVLSMSGAGLLRFAQYVPADKALRLSAEEMIEASWFRMGTCTATEVMRRLHALNVREGEFLHRCGGCAHRFEPADDGCAFTNHLSRCLDTGRLIGYQHDLVLRALVGGLRAAGFQVRLEPEVNLDQADNANRSKADCSLVVDGSPIVVDVVCTGAAVPSNLPKSFVIRGAALVRAQDVKKEKYARINIGGANFVAFAIEGSGLLGPDAVAFIHKVARTAFVDNQLGQGRWSFNLLNAISSAHAKGQAAQLLQMNAQIRPQVNRFLRARLQMEPARANLELGPMRRWREPPGAGNRRILERQRRIQSMMLENDGWLEWTDQAREEMRLRLDQEPLELEEGEDQRQAQDRPEQAALGGVGSESEQQPLVRQQDDERLQVPIPPGLGEQAREDMEESKDPVEEMDSKEMDVVDGDNGRSGRVEQDAQQPQFHCVESSSSDARSEAVNARENDTERRPRIPVRRRQMGQRGGESVPGASRGGLPRSDRTGWRDPLGGLPMSPERSERRSLAEGLMEASRNATAVVLSRLAGQPSRDTGSEREAPLPRDWQRVMLERTGGVTDARRNLHIPSSFSLSSSFPSVRRPEQTHPRR
jgi:hypothetical protein